jgi:hypothetical protein
MLVSNSTYQPFMTAPVSGNPGIEKVDQTQSDPAKGNGVSPKEDRDKSLLGTSDKEKAESARGEELSDKEQKRLQKLKRRDREVRNHEQAHMRAGGSLVEGGPQYEYVTGPDGKQYAINGHVNIDVSPERKPEKTVTKADRIVKAATAPAQPSSDDYAIASNARRMKAKALQQIRQMEQQGTKEKQAEQAYSLGEKLKPNSDSPQMLTNPASQMVAGQGQLSVTA